MKAPKTFDTPIDVSVKFNDWAYLVSRKPKPINIKPSPLYTKRNLCMFEYSFIEFMVQVDCDKNIITFLN